MKKLSILFVLLFALVACGGSDPTPEPTAVSPTEAPAEEATAVPPTVAPAATEESASGGSMVDGMEHTPDSALIDTTWAWERRDNNGNSSDPISVTNAENYTLYFNEDGTFAAKLDCNNGNGNYATQANGGIFMELGPMTMAACGDSSLDTQMMGIFGGAVQDYRIEGEGQVLVLMWAAGGPIDYYRNVASVDLPEPPADGAIGTVTAPDGIFLRTGPGTSYPYVGVAAFGDSGEIIGKSQGGQWWLANSPSLPGGQVWVSASFVEVTNGDSLPVVAAPAVPSGGSLVGVPWEWVSTTDPTGVLTVQQPSNYIVLFNEDGTASIKADCNNAQATYTADASNINITLGSSTMALCSAESLGDKFVSQLSQVAIYFIDGGNLYMDLPADAGTMRFIPQGTVPPSTDAPAGEADGSTLQLISFGPANAPLPIIAGALITANFGDTTVTGSAGCNNYSGQLVPVNDYFTVTNIATTRMMCAENVMAQEQAYLAALQAISGYTWDETLVGNDSVVTQGQIFYTMPDGAAGVMNFSSSQ